MRAPTPRQLEVLRAVFHHAHEFGVAPSLRDLAAALDLAGPASVLVHLRPLREVGLVTWDDGKNRTLRLTVAGRRLLDAEVAA